MKKSKLQIFTYTKGKATGRKGMGMELALLVLLVTVACSILLVSVALLGRSNLNDRTDRMTERFALDQLAEQAMDDPSFKDENYAIYRREYSGWTRNGIAVADPGFEGDAQLVITDPAGHVKLIVAWDGSYITRWEYQ